MHTRRRLFQNAISISPLLWLRSTPQQSTIEVISEPNCLSEESACGFRSLLLEAKHVNRNIILLCGVSQLSKQCAFDLRSRALDGSWIIWENSAFCGAPRKQVLQDAFGIALQDPMAVASEQLYIQYNWPISALTRTFSIVIPVHCARTEVIARYADVPVVMKRRIGRGGIVFLGSMLGPNLRAEEPQARQIATAIFSKTTSACTSREA